MEKVFRLHRHRSSDRFGERVDFRFSNFQASKVPRGYERIMVSIVLVETGKTIAKTGKASVRAGNCQWSDTLKESVWIAQDYATKEPEECLVKLVISLGSLRPGILGEAMLNLTDYFHSRDSGLVSLSLNNGNQGTILQLRIHNLSVATKIRDERHATESPSHIEDSHMDADDFDSKSDESDIFTKSVGSSSSNHIAGSPYKDESGNRSLSAPGSHRSSDSGENFAIKTSLSPINSGAYNYIGRQDSTGSQNSFNNGSDPGDEKNKSRHSSFNSKNKSASNTPTLQHVDSLRELLEAAQETVEELRGESRMWEKTARKFKSDLESLKRDCSDQSKRQEELDAELSVVCSERDGLKLELEQLKLLQEELVVKQQSTIGSPNFQSEDIIQKHKELEDEVKFHKESSANLSLQLKKTQESNIELVLILQELEETIEKQKLELVNSSSQNEVKHQWGTDDNTQEAKDSCQIADKMEMDCLDIIDVDLKNEVEDLKQKIQELEKDCAELTEENLDLIFKLKEAKNTGKMEAPLDSRSNSFQYIMSSSSNANPEQDLEKDIESEGFVTEPFTARYKELEEKCTNLDLDLQLFKDKASDLGAKLQRSELELKEKTGDLKILQKKLQVYEQIERENSDAAANRDTEQNNCSYSVQNTAILSEIHEQLQKLINNIKLPWFESDTCVITESNTSASINSVPEKQQIDIILQNVHEMNKLLSGKMADCRAFFQQEKQQSKNNDEDLFESGKKPSSLHSTYKDNGIGKESFAGNPEMDELRDSLLKKEEEITTLRHLKGELQGKLENALRENDTTSRHLDDVQHELSVFTSSMDSQVLANKMIEKKSLELENAKYDLEFHISELEQENVQLSERISGLEAQLRYLTNEKESSRLELENSKSMILNLKNDIDKLEAEIEKQKAELRQKLHDTQKKFSEAEEESKFIKRSHSKLQTTTESLIDECSSLQKVNGDLRRQKLELHEKCAILEVELSKSQEKSIDLISKVTNLESKFCSLQKDTALKEKSLISQLESVCNEHKKNEEKLDKLNIMLDKMDAEKMDEVESLYREVAHLTSQISSTQDERETTATDAVREVSSLRADKNKLEGNLQEVLAKVKSYETELDDVRRESEGKIQGLIGIIDASKQSEEMLISDIEHMRKSMEDIKSREEKAKRTANELELKLKASEYEIEQLKFEVSSLKSQLQKIPHFQDEIVALKDSLEDAKFEKCKLEESLHLMSCECQEIKEEKVLLVEKMSTMQKALSEGDDARLSKVTLEEKLLRLECDLNARESLFTQEAELKNEINRVKRSNSQYQRRIECLEEEKTEVIRRVNDLEKELKLEKDDKKFSHQNIVEREKIEDHDSESVLTNLEVQSDSSESVKHQNFEDEQDGKRQKDSEACEGADVNFRIQKLETELAEALQKNSTYLKQLQNYQGEKKNASSDASINPANEEDIIRDGQQNECGSLEAELKEMQDRYFQMSLRYAEVEAQREELVMKLKSVNKGKRWFS